MKKLLLVLAVLALLPVPAASAAPINDYLLGTVIPGEPSGSGLEFARLEFFVDWYNTGDMPTPSPTCHLCTYALPGAGNFGATLPDPILAGYVKDEDAADWAGNMFTLPGAYLYMEVKYGDDSAYYYIGEVAPGTEFGLAAPVGFTGGGGVSHINLYNPSTVVPEPATMLLLGTGLLGLAGIARRRRR